jgi:Flp pilus assembly CpaF family ATPase
VLGQAPMSLLKRLQKNAKRNTGSITDVLVTTDLGAEVEAEIDNSEAQKELDRRAAHAAPSAPKPRDRVEPPSETFDRSGSMVVRNLKPDDPTSSITVVRRGKTDTTGPLYEQQSKLPDWLKEDKPTNQQMEVLVPQARRMLNEVLPNEGEEAVDFSEAVHKAVVMAAGALKDESRFTRKDLECAEKELRGLLTGKGPLQRLYDDTAVTDIFVDNHRSIKVIRRGQAIETPFSFRSAEEYRLFITAMLQTVDRTLNISSPIVDCVLNDQWRSRVNAIDSSVIEGKEPKLAIRVPRLQQISFYDVLQTRTLPATLAAWLSEVVSCGDINILVMGATGSGKTVMTTALLSSVGSDERIITIEDVPEIYVPTPHLEKLVSRPPNAQGEGEIKMPELLRAALRRAPHRIVVGEIRDEEGRLFLRALETGHAGSIATLHADSAGDGLWRLLDLVSAYEKAPQGSIMRRIARSVSLVVLMRKIDGRPCVVEISEVAGCLGGEDFEVVPLVRYVGEVNSRRQWKIVAKDSECLRKMQERGTQLMPGPALSAEETDSSSSKV